MTPGCASSTATPSGRVGFSPSGQRPHHISGTWCPWHSCRSARALRARTPACATFTFADRMLRDRAGPGEAGCGASRCAATNSQAITGPAHDSTGLRCSLRGRQRRQPRGHRGDWPSAGASAAAVAMRRHACKQGCTQGYRSDAPMMAMAVMRGGAGGKHDATSRGA